MFPLDYSRFWAYTWAAAALGGLAYALFAKQSPRRGVGFALMTVPLWLVVWGFINSIPALLDGGSVLPARSTYRLSSSYIRGLLIDLGYIGAGFLLWARPSSLRDGARRLREAGFVVRRGEGNDAWAGGIIFPVFLLGSYAANWLIYSQTPGLVNGDESQVWSNMTPYHALMISATAAFTEELVYRVLLLGMIAWAARRIGAMPKSALAGAVVVQALVFGLAHSGYGTWAHIIIPTLFGLFAGALVFFFGVWAAIVVHFLIDVFALGVYAIPAFPWWGTTLVVLLSIHAALTIVWGFRWARQARSRQTPD